MILTLNAVVHFFPHDSLAYDVVLCGCAELLIPILVVSLPHVWNRLFFSKTVNFENVCVNVKKGTAWTKLALTLNIKASCEGTIKASKLYFGLCCEFLCTTGTAESVQNEKKGRRSSISLKTQMLCQAKTRREQNFFGDHID